jgi:uncharacterized membrane protein YeaQ/YmgE (transglycosylase-associated protein family)
MYYRHDYVLAVAWVVTCSVALVSVFLVGARAARWDVLGSPVGWALIGSIAGVLAGVLSMSDPDSYPGRAVILAVIGAVVFGLTAFPLKSAEVPRGFALIPGFIVVGVIMLLKIRAAEAIVLGWTHPLDGPCNEPGARTQMAPCVPKYGPVAMRLYAFDIALLASLFVLQAIPVRPRIARSTNGSDAPTLGDPEETLS